MQSSLSGRSAAERRTTLSLIVAISRSGVIGRGGGLPWRLSADLKRFKSLTMGHHLIMGRKTYDSLGRVLPGRTSIVVTRQTDWKSAPEVLIAGSVDDAIRLAEHDDEVFVIGGAEIFALALPRATRLYVTWVEAEVEGDVFFPRVDWGDWREVSREPHSADAKNEYDTTYCVYDRA